MLRYSLEEKYHSLKDMLAYYLLLQLHTFMITSGEKDLKRAMEALTEKAAAINFEEVTRFNRDMYAEALGTELARHMGETFTSRYKIEKKNRKFTVIMEVCGCIGSIIKHSKRFNLSESYCKAIFCESCMEGYRLSAEKLELIFKGFFTNQGCQMSFANFESEQQ